MQDDFRKQRVVQLVRREREQSCARIVFVVVPRCHTVRSNLVFISHRVSHPAADTTTDTVTDTVADAGANANTDTGTDTGTDTIAHAELLSLSYV